MCKRLRLLVIFAVDFFFVLSGFVIGYAYDDRWAKGMGVMEFFKRRLVRLHPLFAFAVARAAQKLYDIPVKAWLAKFGRR